MAISRSRALEYADELIAAPKSHIKVTLRQSKQAVTLLHGGRALTKCYINHYGMRVAAFMAKAIGVNIPPVGSSVEALISTGVLWRAISISCLNLRKKESYPILERLLEEASMQRSTGSKNLG